MKRIICIVLAVLLSLTLGVTAMAEGSKPSTWASDGVTAAKARGYVPESLLSDYQAPITREEFAMLVSRVYQRLSGKSVAPQGPNPFTDTENPDVLITYKLGIIKGVGDTLFAPERKITRQEVCVILTRTVIALNKDADTAPPRGLSFADEDSIAVWAKDSVKYLFSRGIISGVGGQKIAPLSETTREQAILLVLNLANRYPDFKLQRDILASAVLPRNGSATILVKNIEKGSGGLIVSYDLIERAYLSLAEFEAIKAGKSVQKYGETFTYGVYRDPDDYYFIDGTYIKGPRDVNVIYSDSGEFYSWSIQDQKVYLDDYWYDPFVYKTVMEDLRGTVSPGTKLLLNSLPSGGLNIGDDWTIEYYEANMDTLLSRGAWEYQNRFSVTIENGQWTQLTQDYMA